MEITFIENIFILKSAKILVAYIIAIQNSTHSIKLDHEVTNDDNSVWYKLFVFENFIISKIKE